MKKKQSLNSFLKDELVKLPLFSKDESHHAKKSVADEDDIFVDEDNEPQNDKTTSFYDEEISYEEDEEFQPVSKAKPIVDSNQSTKKQRNLPRHRMQPGSRKQQMCRM